MKRAIRISQGPNQRTARLQRSRGSSFRISGRSGGPGVRNSVFPQTEGVVVVRACEHNNNHSPKGLQTFGTGPLRSN
jgi:hypothetical protein